jgi:hypothetical protein
VLTVRFTYRASGIRYRDEYKYEPLGEVEVIPDFFPSPAALAFRGEGVKVTLALSKKSVEFFKAEAEKHHTQYQRMIRRLLNAYADAQTLPPRPRGRTEKRGE